MYDPPENIQAIIDKAYGQGHSGSFYSSGHGTGNPVGSANLSNEEFNLLLDWDLMQGFFTDPGRMTDAKFDEAVSVFPAVAVEFAHWRLSPSQLRYCILEDSKTVLLTCPNKIPEDMIQTLCEIAPSAVSESYHHKLSVEQLLLCAKKDPWTVIAYAHARLSDEQLLSLIEEGGEEAGQAALQVALERLPRDLLLKIAATETHWGWFIENLSAEETSQLIDANLEAALEKAPDRMSRDQMNKAIELYPETALLRVKRKRYPPGKLEELLDKFPERGLRRHTELMTDEQIERGLLKDSQWASKEALKRASGEVLNHCLEESPTKVLILVAPLISGEQLLGVASRTPNNFFGAFYALSDFEDKDAVSEAFRVAVLGAPGEALDFREDLTEEQVIWCAHQDPAKGLVAAPDVFTDEEFAHYAKLYPEEAEMNSRHRYYPLIEFKRTTRGRYTENTATNWRDTGWETDDLARAQAADPEASPARLDGLANAEDPGVAKAVAANLKTEATTLELLTYHPLGAVQDAAVQNPNLPLAVLVDCARVLDPDTGRYLPRTDSWFLPSVTLQARLTEVSSEDFRFVLAALVEVTDPQEMETVAADTSALVAGMTPSQKVALGNMLDKGNLASSFAEAAEVAKETAAVRKAPGGPSSGQVGIKV